MASRGGTKGQALRGHGWSVFNGQREVEEEKDERKEQGKEKTEKRKKLK